MDNNTEKKCKHRFFFMKTYYATGCNKFGGPEKISYDIFYCQKCLKKKVEISKSIRQLIEETD